MLLLAHSRVSQWQVCIRMQRCRKMPIPTRWGRSTVQWEVEEKLCEGTVALLTESVHVDSVSQDSYGRGKMGSHHTVQFSKSTWHHIKIRERQGPSQGGIQTSEPHERNPCALLWVRNTRRNLAARKMLPWSSLGLRFTLLLKQGQCWAHSEHTKDLCPEELETLMRSRTSTTVATANWEVQTNEEAQVFVCDLDLFVTVKWLDDTPAVLSSGKICEDYV